MNPYYSAERVRMTHIKKPPDDAPFPAFASANFVYKFHNFFMVFCE